MHPMLIAFAELLIISSVIIFDFWSLILMDTSFITWTAKGFSSDTGLVPALMALYPFGPYLALKKPSAIWLLPAFSTQTKRMTFSAFSFFSCSSPNPIVLLHSIYH